MKKFKNIVITILASFFILGLVILAQFTEIIYDKEFLLALKGFGRILLLIVYAIWGFILFALFFFIPYSIYKGLRKTEEDIKDLKYIGIMFGIIIAGLCLLSIAGSSLVGLHMD